MKTRGLAEFRAEYNVWRKDLADELGVREAELERLELIGEVPAEMMQPLTEKYALPENYFTEDIERAAVLEAAAQRYEPKKPQAYFFKVGFVWVLLVALVQQVISLPNMLSTMFGRTPADAFSIIESVCLCAVNIVSGIYLGSHILKKTNFRGSIADYEFLYPYLPSVSVAWLSTLLYSLLYRFTPETGISSGFIVSLVISIAVLLAGTVFITFWLDTAARADGTEKDKRLKILCAVVLASRLLSYVVGMINGSFFDAGALDWVERVLSFLLLLAVLYGVLFGVKKQPNLKPLWLTALPIAAIALPTVFDIL